jgi:hypothetical protein
VAPGVEPIAQDELTTGAQIEWARAVRATVWAQGRWLRRGLETTPDGLDNPGRDGGMPALRETGILAAELATAPARELVLRIGYMYGWTFGSWLGPFDPREGAVLYAGSDYDTGSVNQFGRLPTDMGHRAYIEGARSGEVGPVKLTVSTRFTVASGPPRSVIGDSADGFIYLLPRGSAGRGPLISQANIRIGTTWRGLDITLDLLNVFDRRAALDTDEVFARGTIHPITGGSEADLVFLKNDTGEPAMRRQGYQLGTSFQAPFEAVLGAHKAF